MHLKLRPLTDHLAEFRGRALSTKPAYTSLEVAQAVAAAFSEVSILTPVIDTVSLAERELAERGSTMHLMDTAERIEHLPLWRDKHLVFNGPAAIYLPAAKTDILSPIVDALPRYQDATEEHAPYALLEVTDPDLYDAVAKSAHDLWVYVIETTRTAVTDGEDAALADMGL